MPASVLPRPALTPDAVRALADRSVRRESAASFQALLAAAADGVGALSVSLSAAEGAALSLRQRETVAAVRADLLELCQALAAGVSVQGRCLVPRRRPADLIRAMFWPRAASCPRPTWLGAVGVAVESLGQTAAHVATLASAQPAPSSARALGDAVAERLRAGRDTLLADVARLVD